MAKTGKTTAHKATSKKQSIWKSRSTPVTAESKTLKPEPKVKGGDKKRRTRKREAMENRPLLEPNAAGIDIGAREVYVAVPPDRDQQPVRIFDTFDTFAADLHELANWLTACSITTVAIESTGVYWIPVYEILEAHGIRACVVDTRHMKNVPDPKGSA